MIQVICPTLAVQPTAVIWYNYEEANGDRLLITPTFAVSFALIFIVLFKHFVLFLRLWFYNQTARVVKRLPVLRDIFVSHDLAINTINACEAGVSKQSRLARH